MIIQPKYKNFILALSFKNYLKAKSGMPKVIMAHQNIFSDRGMSYVYLYVAKKSILKNKMLLFCYFGVIIDGVDYGVFSIAEIMDMLSAWSELGHQLLEEHIHSLLFVDLNKVKMLLDKYHDVPIKYFLHDYHLCCSSYHLLNKEGVHCGAARLGETCCANCESYQHSIKFEKRLSLFLTEYSDRICFIAPSESTKQIFNSFHPEYEKNTLVIPHQKFEGTYKGNMKAFENSRTIHVGYLGAPNAMKGWETWKKLVALYGNKKDYKFFVFNNQELDELYMEHVSVEFSADNQNPMIDALRRNEIDVAVFWSQASETYSYTCMEAYAANVFILTNHMSGNIQDFVKKNNNGCVFYNIDELISFFQDPQKVRASVADFYNTQKYGPNHLVNNDQVCNYEKMECGENLEKTYRARKSLFSKMIEFLYNNYVKKY